MVQSLSRVPLYSPCDPMDGSPIDSSIHGIFQARILEWVPFFLRGILLTQRSKPGLPHCRWFLAFQVDSLSTEAPGKPQKGVIGNS